MSETIYRTISMSEAEELKAKITDLETRIAFQEQTIEDLNKTITGQWDEFERLRREIARLDEQLARVQPPGHSPGNGEPPPPHY